MLMVPSTFRSQAVRQRASSTSKSVPPGIAPALLTRMSTFREEPRKPPHIGAVAEIGRVVASLDLRARDVEIGGAGHQRETAALGRERLARRAPDAARTAGDESEPAAGIEVHRDLT
jgi:hypothetical protein